MRRMSIKRTLTAAIAAFLLAGNTQATNLLDSLTYNLRLGYNIGGTAPIGMPSTIRSLDRYSLTPSISMGLGVYKRLSDHWGITTGLHLENKGMDIKASVKNYHTAIVRGGQRLEGNFTGQNSTEVEQWMLTLPLQATYAFTPDVRLRLGPYLSYVSSHYFRGYASDGYLRVGDPTGTKVELGHDEGTRGSYDFSDDMRRVQFGLMLGADWYFQKHWGVFADLSWGLNGVFNNDFNTIEQTLYPIYGTIGVAYRFK